MANSGRGHGRPPGGLAAAGYLVLVSIPLSGYPASAGALDGKTVLDTGNYYPQRDGQIPPLDAGELTGSEYLAGHIPGARVVKVFNNIFFKHLQNLARPADAADRTYLPVAGDNSGAKISVVASSTRSGTARSTTSHSPRAGGSSREPRSTGPLTGNSRTRRAPRQAQALSGPRSPPRPGCRRD